MNHVVGEFIFVEFSQMFVWETLMRGSLSSRDTRGAGPASRLGVERL